MREVLKSVRQHLFENENDIRGYDENPKNFDKVMEQLDDMESMLNDQDDYEFKHGEIKSPLRQAAETIQGGASGASGTKKYNQKDLQKLANNYLNYHLGYNETDATADKVEIVSEPDEHGNVDAKVSYDVSVRIPYQDTDSDGYTRTTYEEDSEYRTDIISLNISELKPEEPDLKKN